MKSLLLSSLVLSIVSAYCCLSGDKDIAEQVKSMGVNVDVYLPYEGCPASDLVCEARKCDDINSLVAKKDRIKIKASLDSAQSRLRARFIRAQTFYRYVQQVLNDTLLDVEYCEGSKQSDGIDLNTFKNLQRLLREMPRSQDNSGLLNFMEGERVLEFSERIERDLAGHVPNSVNTIKNIVQAYKGGESDYDVNSIAVDHLKVYVGSEPNIAPDVVATSREVLSSNLEDNRAERFRGRILDFLNEIIIKISDENLKGKTISLSIGKDSFMVSEKESQSLQNWLKREHTHGNYGKATDRLKSLMNKLVEQSIDKRSWFRRFLDKIKKANEDYIKENVVSFIQQVVSSYGNGIENPPDIPEINVNIVTVPESASFPDFDEYTEKPVTVEPADEEKKEKEDFLFDAFDDGFVSV